MGRALGLGLAVCKSIHRDYVDKFKYALVWGTSAKHQPQRVGIAHVLEDEGWCPPLTPPPRIAAHHTAPRLTRRTVLCCAVLCCCAADVVQLMTK